MTLLVFIAMFLDKTQIKLLYQIKKVASLIKGSRKDRITLGCQVVSFRDFDHINFQTRILD